MLKVKRSKVIEKLQAVEIVNYNGHNHLVQNAMDGDGGEAMAFLVKKGDITFPPQQLKEELDNMVEKSLLTIGQWESMTSMLQNAENGKQRVLYFLKRKRRITVI